MGMWPVMGTVPFCLGKAGTLLTPRSWIFWDRDLSAALPVVLPISALPGLAGSGTRWHPHWRTHVGPSAPLFCHQHSLAPIWFCVFTLKCIAFAFGHTLEQPAWCLWELGCILTVFTPLSLLPLGADPGPPGGTV